MPPKSKLNGADWLRPLAYPAFHTVAEQDDARLKLQAILGNTEAELDRQRRERQGEPAQNVTTGKD